MNYDDSDVQPGILKSHGRKYTNYLLLNCKITCNLLCSFRNWIGSILKDERCITDFEEQLSNSYFRKHNKSKYKRKAVVTIAIGKSLFDQLKLIEYKFAMEPPREEIFRSGMFAQKEFLHDYFSWQSSETEDGTIDQSRNKVDPFYLEFEPDGGDGKRPVSRELELFLIISHQFKGELKAITQEILYAGKKFIKYFSIEETAIVKNDKSQSLAPLCFVDGVSERKDISLIAKNALIREQWRPSEEKKHYGSYIAFRKIEVSKQKFEDEVKKMAISIEGSCPVSLAKAMVIGRFQEGAPLINFDSGLVSIDAWSIKNKDIPFNFDNDPDGNKCPVHAHVRRMRFGGRPRIVRRGTTYPQTLKKERIEGLCFLSYQSKLKDFQNLFALMGRDNTYDPVDMLLYSPSVDGKEWKSINLPTKWSGVDRFSTTVMGQKITVFRGGGYFYVPSVSFIRSLAK